MPTTTEYRCVDLFAGAGGLSLGLEQAGLSMVFANEIDQYAAATYKKNRNLSEGSVFIGDITNLNDNISEIKLLLGDVFLVCGGPPCQGFSNANRQRLIADPRNKLYLEFLKFLKHIKPHFFIMENVRGMMQKVDEVLDDFSKFLGSEYNIDYMLLNARNYSVPQNRERLFVIGNNLGISSRDIAFRMYHKSLKEYTLHDAIADLPELKPNPNKYKPSVENEEIGCFKRPFNYTETEFTKFINNERTIKYLYNHKNRYNNSRDIKIFQKLPQGANSLHESIRDIMPYASRNHVFKDKYFKLRYDQVSKTITAHMRNDCNMYIHPTQPRGLSPREAARVQTFPDDYVFYGPPNNWYQQIGNAVPVKLAEEIGKTILSCLN